MAPPVIARNASWGGIYAILQYGKVIEFKVYQNSHSPPAGDTSQSTRRTKQYNRREPTAKLYYTSLTRPLLEYAATTFYNMSGTNAQILERITNKCLRIITKAHSRTHRRVLRNLTHIPSLASRHTYLYLCEFLQTIQKHISKIAQCTTVQPFTAMLKYPE